MPSFDGTAPEAGGIIDSITKALERLLQERKISGRVEYMPAANTSGSIQEHVFSVKNLNIAICSLSFSNANAIQEGELLKNSKPLLEGEYSRRFTVAFAKANLLPIYWQRGYLRANFRDPQAKPESTSDCKNGVAVTLPIEEGAAYVWDGAEWTGNQALSAQELDASLGMKSGELANGLKIDAGLKVTQEAYGKKGYILARLNPTPDFKDASRRALYRININEGPQFRMGNLIINGLSESDVKKLKSKWQLQQGEAYNASYPKEFMKNVLENNRTLGFSPKKIEIAEKPDRQNVTVDVMINLK